MRCFGYVFALALATSALAAPTFAQSVAPAAQAATLLPVADKDGKVLLTLPPAGADGTMGRYLYATTLRTGLGSAPIGLDRASFGPTQLLVFRRIGNKVAIQFESGRFRATGAPAAEQAAAHDSFANSTVWMGDIASTDAKGNVTIDISGFLSRDLIGIAGALDRGGAKGFRQVDTLSAADPESIKAFPDNIEIDALLTFASDTPGDEVENIAPDPHRISFVLHHSLVRLPGPGYAPRRFDPRVGGFGSQAIDFAAPLGQDVVYDVVNRFRLEKIDPTAPRSRVKKPIVFYIDRAAPEPIRSALVEGVNWWAEAFDKAGYIDAFRAEVLPDNVDPMDVRYNVVNWVNRATRGWSYGQVITDPRTGEIVKGSVLLGSLRVRQDMLIYESLVGADKVGKGGPGDPVQVALARIRQLGAHEVGHALGLVHNFAGSTQGRASVMDYPAPRITLVDGKPDLSDAYGVGVGSWDKFAIDWAYGAPPPGGDAEAAARAKADAMIASGARFVSDGEARAPSSAQPWGSLWDDGADPVAELNRMMTVRAAALAQFGAGALRPGEPYAELRRKFVPVWLLHRYQVEAAAKLVGGVDFTYAVKGDAQPEGKPVPAAAQMGALNALLSALTPEALTVPPGLLPLLSAADSGNDNRQYDVEVMNTAGGPVFDPLVAADTAATVVLGPLLDQRRLARLQLQHMADPSLPGIETLLAQLEATVLARRDTPVARRIAYRTAMLLAQAWLAPGSDPEVAAVIGGRLARIAKSLDRDGDWGRSVAALLRDRDALREELAKQAKPPAVPPGMPIGAGEGGWMDD